jgi:hypothetical protein
MSPLLKNGLVALCESMGLLNDSLTTIFVSKKPLANANHARAAIKDVALWVDLFNQINAHPEPLIAKNLMLQHGFPCGRPSVEIS